MKYSTILRSGFLLFYSAFVFALSAQETNFTQFYNLRTAFNPAYVSVPNGVELSTGYRQQWPSLQEGIHGAFAGVTIRQCGTPLAYGLTVAQVGEDVFGYRVREATFQLSAFVNTSSSSSLHLGMQAAVGTRGIDANRQVFSGQLDPIFGIVHGNDAFVSVNQASVRTFSLGGGLVWRGELKLGSLDGPVSAGLAVHNLGGSRDISLQNIETNLQPRFIAHASVAFPIAEAFRNKAAMYISPLLRLDMQGDLRETYAGCIVQFQSAYLGVIYQHARNPVNLGNTNSLSIAPGVEITAGDKTHITIGYSFDMPLSGLGASATGGSHELSVRFSFERTCLFGSAGSGHGGRRKGLHHGGRQNKVKCYEFDGKNFLRFLN